MKKIINWEEVQDFYNKGNSIIMCAKHFSISNGSIFHAKKKGLFITRSHEKSMSIASENGRMLRESWSEEKRKKQSETRKKFLEENPEKHPNVLCAKNKKMITYPEKLAFSFLQENNIPFTHNEPICGFFPDILLEDKIIIEIDGEQWHSSDEQKEFDMNRDSILEKNGYKVIRIPAKNVIENLNILFDKNFVVDESKLNDIKVEGKKKNYCIECGEEIFITSKRCNSCSAKKEGLKSRKFNPSKEELDKLLNIDKISLTELGKKYGVTDNAVKKRAKKFDIYNGRKKNYIE